MVLRLATEHKINHRKGNPMKIKIVATSLSLLFIIGLALTARAGQDTAVQTATVEVTEKGFSPTSINLKPDAPARITFVRRTDETCAKEVVIKDYDIKRDLPLNQPVVVEFTPKKGEFTFACGMAMMRGKLVVR
jgi:plastocyanin domain-containing protein